MAEHCVLFQLYTDTRLTLVEAQGVHCCKCLTFLCLLSTFNSSEDDCAVAWLWLPNFLTKLDHNQTLRPHSIGSELYGNWAKRDNIFQRALGRYWDLCFWKSSKRTEINQKNVLTVLKSSLRISCIPALPMVSLVLEKSSILIRNSTFCLRYFDLDFCPHNQSPD